MGTGTEGLRPAANHAHSRPYIDTYGSTHQKVAQPSFRRPVRRTNLPSYLHVDVQGSAIIFVTVCYALMYPS